MYRTLDADRIIATIVTLEQRIAARFPEAGLRKVCNELLEVARDSKLRATAAARPKRGLRAGVAALLGLGLLLLAYVASIIEVKRDAENLYGVLQGIDAAMNILVLMGAGVLFLFTVEARSNRARALSDLNELRSIVHVIDMHQLTKDPSTMAAVGTGTSASPQRQLTAFELVRYLDYCSEMLSLAAKVAALYAQETRDPVVIETESDLVQITSNLSNKIWQKITIVQYHLAAGDGAKAGSAALPPVAKASPVQPSRQVLDP
ncbi:MAG: hypothetical protein ABL908_16880 [Hyphomicrobium sp.]